MKKLIWSIVISLALAVGWLSLPTPRAAGENIDEFPERDFAVRAARVFTGESLLAPGVVVVRDGKIEQVGETAEMPEGFPLLDLGERTLMPGLIDAHVHAFGTGAEDALNFGVTTVLDQVNDPGQIALLQRAAKGARVFSAGTPATAPGGHGTQYDFEVPVIEGPDDVPGFVDEISAAGSDWMKIIIEPRMATLDEATVHALASEARDRDMLTVAHVSRQEHARWTHEAGVDGLVHIFRDEPADPELAAAMAARDMFVAPTLVVLQSVAGLAQLDFSDNPNVEPWLSGGQRASLDQAMDREENPEMRQRVLDSTLALFEAGVPILAGSDAPNQGTAQGLSLHTELQLLVEAGLSPEQVLTAATAMPAKYFRLDDRGLLAPGRRADLLAVDGNPLENIEDTLAIHAIWQGGRHIPRVRASDLRGDPVPEHGRLSAFTSEQAAAGFGAGWEETSDSMFGGNSSVAMTSGAEDGRTFIRLSGETAAGFIFPWAGTMVFPGEFPMAAADLSNFTRLVFMARGDIDSLNIMAFSPSLGQMPAVQPVSLSDDWREISLELEAFAGAEAAAIQGFSFAAGMPAGPFVFDLAEVRLE